MYPHTPGKREREREDNNFKNLFTSSELLEGKKDASGPPKPPSPPTPNNRNPKTVKATTKRITGYKKVVLASRIKF